jgi:hypothetical protein
VGLPVFESMRLYSSKRMPWFNGTLFFAMLPFAVSYLAFALSQVVLLVVSEPARSSVEEIARWFQVVPFTHAIVFISAADALHVPIGFSVMAILPFHVACAAFLTWLIRRIQGRHIRRLEQQMLATQQPHEADARQ